MSDDNVTIGQITYKKDMVREATQWVIIVFFGCMLIATLGWGVSAWGSHNLTTKANSDYRRSVASQEFFMAIQDKNPDLIKEESLQSLYNDVTSFQSIETGSALIPDTLNEVEFTKDMYGDVCHWLFDFANGNVTSTQCYNYGNLSDSFLRDYAEAEAGISRWEDLTFEKPENKFDGLFGMGIWGWWLLGWWISMIINTIIVITYADNRWNKADEPWYTVKNSKWILLVAPSTIGVILHRDVKISRHLNDQRKKLSVRRWNSEILMLEQKLAKLKDLPTTTTTQNSIKTIKAVIKDLKDYDTEMSEKTANYLAKEYAEEARNLKGAIKAGLDAYDTLPN